MQIDTKHRAFMYLLLAHLTVVAAGAAYVDFYDLGGKLLELYGALSGASSSYGFFAPGVGAQLRAVFIVTDSSGKKTEATLLDADSHEVNLRIGNMIDEFIDIDAHQGPDHDEAQRKLAASFASSVLTRYPGARTITVRLEKFDPVSMAEYKLGKRPAWEPFYRAEFVTANSST